MAKSPFPPSLFDNDCERPACADTVSALNAAMSHAEKSNNVKRTSGEKGHVKFECPPSSSELGTGTWKLLHSMAAWYPENPTHDDQIAMKGFISTLAKFYPCTYCAADFQENIEKFPVKTTSRKDLSQWLCQQHNVVNTKLGKSNFKCDMKTLDERWRVWTPIYPHCQ